MLSPAAIDLLRRLSDGKVHSSPSLARECLLPARQIARLAHEAADAGVMVEALRGRGYRLAEPIAFIDTPVVQAALADIAPVLALSVVDATGSTNSDLIARAARESVHGRVLVAELQTAGRGRRGQSWVAALGGSLTFSIGWSFSRPAPELGGLSLAIGVALVRGLRRLDVQGVRLKWPNDLVWNLLKVGGILVECVTADGAEPATAVIGIGLNAHLPDAARDRIAAPVTDLGRISGRRIDRGPLLVALLRELVPVLEDFDRQGFAGVREEWTGLHEYHGRPVTLRHTDGSTTTGTVSGVADDGALLLARDGRVERMVAGDLSLRG